MRKYVTSVILAAVLLCALTIPAAAAGPSIAFNPRGYAFTGTVQEVIQDETGAVKQLQVYAPEEELAGTISNGICLVNFYYDTVFVDSQDGTTFDPADLREGETVSIHCDSGFYYTTPTQTLALAVLRGPAAEGFTVGSVTVRTTTPGEKDGIIFPVSPDVAVSRHSGTAAAYPDVKEKMNVLVWFPEGDLSRPIQRILILDTPGTETLTRGTFAALLHGAMGHPVVNYAMTYTDVAQDSPNAEAIRWAASEGYLLGYGDGTFRPDAPMDRQQVATVLWRVKGEPRYDCGMSDLTCADRSAISAYALPAMDWAYHEVMVCEDANGCIRPHGRVTVAKADRMMAQVGIRDRDWLPNMD